MIGRPIIGQSIIGAPLVFYCADVLPRIYSFTHSLTHSLTRAYNVSVDYFSLQHDARVSRCKVTRHSGEKWCYFVKTHCCCCCQNIFVSWTMCLRLSSRDDPNKKLKYILCYFSTAKVAIYIFSWKWSFIFGWKWLNVCLFFRRRNSGLFFVM